MRNIPRHIVRLWRYTGLVAAVTAWIFISLSIAVNPWFDPWRDALSDLGVEEANMPWIYNYGLITTGLIIMLYSGYLVYTSKGKLEAVGGGYVFIGGIFLALIGIFPGGTRPHIFVSTYFFVQMGLAILAMGLGTWGRERLYSGICIAIFILMLLGTFIDWPSAALIEIYETILLDLWVLARTFVYRDLPTESYHSTYSNAFS